MMNNFRLKSLDGPDQELEVVIGNDGDICITIWDYDDRYNVMVPHTVRVGMGPNSGDPNGDVKDIKYLKGALRNLAMEFKYQNEYISKDDIERYRNAPKVSTYLESWFDN